MNQTDTDRTDGQPILEAGASPVNALAEFPVVKTIRRGWLTTGFVAWLVGIVISSVLMVAAFFYVKDVLTDFGVTFHGNRVEMTFSDGSSVNLNEVTMLNNMPFNNNQLHEISEKIEAYEEGGAWVQPLCVFFGAYFLMTTLCLLFYIQGCMMVYKGWKSLQPLRTLDARNAQGMPGPVLSLVLLLVPYVNIVWCYFCLTRYARYGRNLANALGRSYRGPGAGLGLCLCVLYSVQIIGSLILSFSSFGTPMIDFFIYSIVFSILSNLIMISVGFVFLRRLSLMVEDFGSIDRKGE